MQKVENPGWTKISKDVHQQRHGIILDVIYRWRKEVAWKSEGSGTLKLATFRFIITLDAQHSTDCNSNIFVQSVTK